MEWISVDDKMPNDGANVLVVDEDSNVHMAWVRATRTDFWDCDTYGLAKEEAAYWMPVPDPPNLGKPLEKCDVSTSCSEPSC